MTMNECSVATGADLDPAVALFHSLSDGTRLAIATRLSHGGEARVADLMAEPRTAVKYANVFPPDDGW